MTIINVSIISDSVCPVFFSLVVLWHAGVTGQVTRALDRDWLQLRATPLSAVLGGGLQTIFTFLFSQPTTSLVVFSLLCVPCVER